MHYVILHRLGLISSPSPRFKRLYPYLNSKRGIIVRSLLIPSCLIFFSIIAGITLYLSGSKELLPPEQAAPLNSFQTDQPAKARTVHPVLGVNDNEHSLQNKNDDLWQAFQDIIRVERVDYSGDPKKKKRSIAKKNYKRVKQLLKSLRSQGLEGDALYHEAENQLAEAYGLHILKMLEGYRLLEEELAKADLNALAPEERFDYTQNVRQYAFGEERADHLFFEQETFARYQLDENAIMEDTSLSSEAAQEMLFERRKTLHVDLAARGAYISFADKRKEELENKLQARYGDSLEAMTAEERKVAIWDMYSDELPSEIMDKVGRILTVQAEKKAALEAYQRERETVLNDLELTFAQKQEQLAELKERFNITL